jgi:hypothetical protein
VACGALAGAAASMVSYTIETAVEHKGSFSGPFEEPRPFTAGRNRISCGAGQG